MRRQIILSVTIFFTVISPCLADRHVTVESMSEELSRNSTLKNVIALGDACNFTSDCRRFINNSDCFQRECRCSSTHPVAIGKTFCLKVKAFGQDCRYSEQCEYFEPTSVCATFVNVNHKICSCPIGYYQKKAVSILGNDRTICQPGFLATLSPDRLGTIIEATLSMFAAVAITIIIVTYCYQRHKRRHRIDGCENMITLSPSFYYRRRFPPFRLHLAKKINGSSVITMEKPPAYNTVIPISSAVVKLNNEDENKNQESGLPSYEEALELIKLNESTPKFVINNT